VLLLNIFQYLINIVATLLGGVLLLRFWMQAVRVRPPGSVAQFTYTLSDWLVKPLRRVMPGIGGYDWASLVGAFLVVVLASAFFFLFGFDAQAVLLHALLRFVSWIIYGFMALLIIEAVFSWINPNAPLAPFVHALNEPLLRPVRRVVPPLGGLDLSVLVVLVTLQILQSVISKLVIDPIPF
jgi:YggT family protein